MTSVPHGKSTAPRLFVLGAGYVGGAVVQRAREAGWHVTALTRNPATADELRGAGVEVVVADAASVTWHDAVAPRPDYVLNALSGGGGTLDAYRHSYVYGMRSLSAWLRQTGPAGTVVYTSSTSVYSQDGGVTVDETAAVDTADARRALLVEAEDTLRGAAVDRWFILRLAGIYGPGRHYLLDQIRTGSVAGSGEHRLNLAHRDDIVAAIFACFAAPASTRNEVFNVADDAPATKQEVVAWSAARLGVPCPPFTGQSTGRRAATPDRVIANRKLRTLLPWRPQFADFRAGYEAVLRRER